MGITMINYTNFTKDGQSEKPVFRDTNDDLEEAALDLYGEPTIYN